MPQNLPGTGLSPVGMNSRLGVTLAAAGTIGSNGTVIKASPGRVRRVAVVVAGTAGTVNDVASVPAIGTTVSSTTILAPIPATVGVLSIEAPAKNGIVLIPGAGQTLNIFYD